MDWVKITPEVTAALLPDQQSTREHALKRTQKVLVCVRNSHYPEDVSVAFGYLVIYGPTSREWRAMGYTGDWIISHYCPIPDLPGAA